MNLTEQINSDIKTAMKAREVDALRTLRSVKAALLLESTKGGDSELTDELGLKILTKLYKQRVESAEVFRSQGREDLAEIEDVEAKILSAYLPEQMSEEDVKAVIQDIITQTGASTMKDMGKVMGMAGQKMAGKADGKLIANIVKAILG